MLRSPDAQGSWVRYWLSSHKQLVQSHEKPHLCQWDSLWEYVLWKAVVCHQVLRVKAMPCPMHFLISRGYLPICRLPQPYNSILSCVLLLHSGIPDLGTCLSYLSRSCKVRGKGMSMSQLGSPAWQLWQSHRAYAPVMAIRSFFLFTPWMEMESLSPESTTHMSFFFLSILSAFPAVYLFFILFCPQSSSSCAHWQVELHSEVFPASTLSSVVSKEKIPWTRSTWRNHSLSRVPQR